MNWAPDLLVGLDLGTTSTKALLLDRAGNELALAAVETPFATSTDGVEASADQLRQTLSQVLAELGAGRQRVAAIGIAGMAESGAPIDRHGRALAPVIAWHDQRGADVVARLDERFGPALPRAIGRRAGTVSSAAKLGWLLDHGVDSVESWLGVPELCLCWLTGRRATEFSLAARTGWYDVAERRYLPEVAAALGIPACVFPAVEAAGSVMGRVSAAGAASCGLPEGAAVTIAGHDHLVGSRGSGARTSDLVNSVGTAETIVAGDRDFPDVDLALALRVAVTVMPGGKRWAMLASAARSGIVLAAVADALGCSVGELDERVGASGGTARTVDISRTVDIGDLLGRIERGEPVASSPDAYGAVWSALLHALAARTWEGVDRLSQVTGPFSRLVVFGGGSRSRPWLAAKSDLGPMPVWRSGTTEAVARGAALFGGVAAGWWPSTDQGPQATLEPITGAV